MGKWRQIYSLKVPDRLVRLNAGCHMPLLALSSPKMDPSLDFVDVEVGSISQSSKYHSPGLRTRPVLIFSRYPEGVMPVIFLNILLKLALELKPEAKAMSRTVCAGSLSR
jgi:hypothetical protein